MIDMEEKTKVVIYARVSTSAQDYTRQITELRKYAKKQNFEIVKEFSEKISGGKKVEERMDLVRTLVTLGRGTREKERIKVKNISIVLCFIFSYCLVFLKTCIFAKELHI